LGVLGHVTLYEQGGPGGIDADGDEKLGQLEGAITELGRVLGNGEGVEIDHAEDRLGLLLVDDPVAQGPEEVAQLDRTGGLDAREHSRHPADARGRRSGARTRFARFGVVRGATSGRL
jgi:hypothetical protein